MSGIRLFGGHAGVPQIAKHFRCKIEQVRRWAQAAKHGVEFTFQHIAPHGFAPRNTALGLAQIIGVTRRAAFAPASRVGRAAIGTGDVAPKREILVHILSREHTGLALDDVLNGLIRFQRNDGFMLAALHDDAPFRRLDISGVKRSAHQFGDTLDCQGLPHLGRPCGLRFDEAHNLRHSAKAARGEAFIGLLND
ncbi:MAG: hypothetical protein ABIO86_11635 [Sphingomonas sp.]